MAEQQQQQQGFTSHIAGMTKQELYDIMCQMKDLIEQNRPQAKQILTANNQLCRALFQAQIMLGMVKPPEVMPNIQETFSTSQPTQVGQPNTQSVPVQGGLQGHAANSSQTVPARQQHLTQPSVSLPTTVPAPSLTLQSQSLSSNLPHSVQQAKGFVNPHTVPAPTPPPSSQIQNMPPPSSQIQTMPPPPPPAPSHYPPQHLQQSLQPTAVFHQPLQPPPLPQQPRPSTMQPFSHQPHSQMPHGFQVSNAPPAIVSQTMFHPANNPPAMFPTTFPLPQQPYQGGPHLGPDYGNHAGASMHAEGGAPWGPSQPEKTSVGPPQMLGAPPMGPSQMAPSTGGQPPRPPPLTPEMEQVLLNQVMSLTAEQINLLPPEQRQQVIQLQDMLR